MTKRKDPKDFKYKKVIYEKLADIAEKHEGKCLINYLTDYKNNKDKILWQCKYNHQWLASADNVLNKNKWCPTCSKNKKYTIQEMQVAAKERGGKCLSNIYDGARNNLLWQCKNGHEFKMTPSRVIANDRWCSECRIFYGEEIIRYYLEYIFEDVFIKIKPEWLRNNYNYKLELDGYCSKLNIAFEHQGMQHYKITNFSRTEEKLKIIQNNDKIKREICKILNINLLIIPQLFVITKFKDLKNIILEFCKNTNIIVSNKIYNDEISKISFFDKIYENRKR